MKHAVRRERILGSNWGFGSLYILIIAKEIFHVCLINPYGNLYYIDDLENIIEQLIAGYVKISSTSHEANQFWKHRFNRDIVIFKLYL